MDEYRAALMANVQDISPLFLLMDALAASGKANEIDVGDQFVGHAGAGCRTRADRFAFESIGLYYAGKSQGVRGTLRHELPAQDLHLRTSTL